MEVRAADGAGGDLDDGVAPVLDLGIRHGVAANVVLAVPGQRSHSEISIPRNVLRQIPEGTSVPWGRGNDIGKQGLECPLPDLSRSSPVHPPASDLNWRSAAPRKATTF